MGELTVPATPVASSTENNPSWRSIVGSSSKAHVGKDGHFHLPVAQEAANLLFGRLLRHRTNVERLDKAAEGCRALSGVACPIHTPDRGFPAEMARGHRSRAAVCA